MLVTEIRIPYQNQLNLVLAILKLFLEVLLCGPSLGGRETQGAGR